MLHQYIFKRLLLTWNVIRHQYKFIKPLLLHWPMLQGRCWCVVLCFTGLCLYKASADLWFYALLAYVTRSLLFCGFMLHQSIFTKLVMGCCAILHQNIFTKLVMVCGCYFSPDYINKTAVCLGVLLHKYIFARPLLICGSYATISLVMVWVPHVTCLYLQGRCWFVVVMFQ